MVKRHEHFITFSVHRYTYSHQVRLHHFCLLTERQTHARTDPKPNLLCIVQHICREVIHSACHFQHVMLFCVDVEGRWSCTSGAGLVASRLTRTRRHTANRVFSTGRDVRPRASAATTLPGMLSIIHLLFTASTTLCLKNVLSNFCNNFIKC